MRSLTAWMDRRLYPDVEERWDDKLFGTRVQSLLRSTHHVLDLGAGAGIVPEMNFKGRTARMCGVDLDPRVLSNPLLDEGKVADAGVIPYPDASFDLVFADNVMEHLAQPQEVLKEVYRVLKPGGWFLFKTPNATHYMPMIARVTPHSFHRFVNRLRGRAELDTFPTRYKANTRHQVRGLAQRAGFVVENIRLVESRPEYMRMFAPLYVLGFLYERLVNATELLSAYRILLIAELRKPG